MIARQPSTTGDTQSPQEKFRENVAAIQGLGLPIGWSGDPRTWPARIPAHLLGWIITAFAVSLGAPFGFDVLNKIIVVRSTIKPHEKSRKQPSKDRPAPDTKAEASDESSSAESPSKDE